MESHDPEEEKTEPASSPVESPPTKVGGVEDVQSAPSDPAPSTGEQLCNAVCVRTHRL